MSSSAAPTSRDPEHVASTFLYCVAVIILLVAAASPAQAQSYYFGQATFSAGNTPSAIVVADLNHDGMPDTIVANAQDDTISVLLGKPDGTFGAQTTFPVGHTPISVVTGDFNGDGNVDVAVLNANCIPSRLGEVCYGGWISLLLGKGDGTFLPAVNYAVGSAGGRYATLLTADLNGDGQLDLVAPNGADRTISVLLNNGAGGFQDQVVYSVPNGAQSLAIADFNGDHKLDIAVTGSTMSVLLGNGNGTFQPPVVSGGLGGSIAVADFNHDGKLDAVTTPSQLYGGGYLTVLLGNGDGTFTPVATFSVAANFVYTADLNGDGKADLVLLEGSNGNGIGFTVELGNGDGTFQAGVNYGGGASPSAAAIADINGDGRLDVLTANASGNNVSAALGYGNGTFVTFTDYQSAQYAILSADFNGDQKPDLAAITNNDVEVMLNNGNGTFAFPKQTALTQSTFSLIAGDFNHDGRQDVATVFSNCNNGCQPGTAAVLLGNGDGTFQPEQLATVGLNPVALASGDFNRDDKLDLVVANENANTISVLLGNGDGTFQTHVDYTTTASPHFVAVADLNGDGNPDIVVLDSGFSIFFGNGDGTFGTRVDNASSGGSQVIIADFNGDGIPDLCFQTSNGLTVLLGNGDGTFQTPLYSPGYGTPYAAADFNGDSKLDIVSQPLGSPLFLQLGNGNGTFGLEGSYRVSDGLTYYLAVADFNGDGVPDIATNGQTNSVSVQLSVPFKAVSPAAVNFGSQGVSTASAPQTVTITNSSNVKINVSSIVTAAPFSQTNDCSAALEPGASCTASVVFTPSATGLDSGVLTIADSTFNSPTHVQLSGTGVSGPFLTPAPARVQFQPINVGSSSNPMSVQLKNSGNANLTISSIVIAGVNSSDYTQTNNCPGSLPVGQSCTANVTFTPTAGGVRAANLAITDNASGSPQTVPLSGIGLALENTLTVVIHGSGGQVNSRDGFIHCPGACTHVYPAGAQVTLTTTVDEYWRFYDWDGNCSGSNCVLNMTQNLTAIANFQYTYPGLEFVPITPCRMADTRWPVGQWGGPALQGGTARTYPMVGGTCNLPQNAIAFSLNLTVIPHGYLGYLTVWPGSQNQPLVSTMNSLDGRIKANAAIVPAGNDSNSIEVYASDTTDFVMDVDGYFQQAGANLGFYPLPPCRVVDTRGANGDLGGPFLTGGAERDFPLLESSCIPQGVTPQAYSLNVTAVPHTAGQPLSYLTVWQQGQAKPLASTLNNPTATIVANAALVVAGQSGGIATYPSDDTDLVVDINGYFANYQQGALLFYPLYPCRVLDTRQGAGAFSGQLSPPVDVIDNPCGANSTAQAYIFNATVVPSPSLSYLTLWPDGQNRPVVSTLNAVDGWITSNMAIVPTTNGSIDAYAAGMTQLILDISGYFAP